MAATPSTTHLPHFDLYPPNVGILGIQSYFPSTYVSQSALEKEDGVEGKYVVGLGQNNMAFCSYHEDINSICLTVVAELMESYGIRYSDIGRLEVGTETIIDRSKSVKTTLMSLFHQEHDFNSDVEGVDSINACYGGTAALLNTINWIESSSWDGRYGLVVCADIAVYSPGPARPTGGAGAIALLIGPDAPLPLERGVRGTYMENCYDFYKPDPNSEYPVVDGSLSITCYYRALHRAYTKYKSSFYQTYGTKFDIKQADYVTFHSPYHKLVQKSFARLIYQDLLDLMPKDRNALGSGSVGVAANPVNATDELTESDKMFAIRVSKFVNQPEDESYNNKELEQILLQQSLPEYQLRLLPSVLLPKELGNLYTASLYSSLLSVLHQIKPVDQLKGKRILLFSYGSGLAATMFSIRIPLNPTKTLKISLDTIVAKTNLDSFLNNRICVPPHKYRDIMLERERFYHDPRSFYIKNNNNSSEVYDIFNTIRDGTFYLDSVDSKYRRIYKRKGKL